MPILEQLHEYAADIELTSASFLHSGQSACVEIEREFLCLLKHMYQGIFVSISRVVVFKKKAHPLRMSFRFIGGAAGIEPALLCPYAIGHLGITTAWEFLQNTPKNTPALT
ncbi:MAG: hypothetical protein Q7V20_16425 [Aquabacterium sp.]|uniref:hypothetical protein n=1 Tax=Aquabacterium sp. TaxID=1872578 RepID=UPI0027281C0C|nr:hypothetical protein [Aquabacterium sp.]MDO9005031.1 hypothetical protein [Aquabacterium sp.]